MYMCLQSLKIPPIERSRQERFIGCRIVKIDYNELEMRPNKFMRHLWMKVGKLSCAEYNIGTQLLIFVFILARNII